MFLSDVSIQMLFVVVHLVTLVTSKHQLLVSSSHVKASALRVAKGGRAFEAREVFVAVRVLHVSSKIRLAVALEITFLAFKLLVSVQGSQMSLKICNALENRNTKWALKCFFSMNLFLMLVKMRLSLELCFADFALESLLCVDFLLMASQRVRA